MLKHTIKSIGTEKLGKQSLNKSKNPTKKRAIPTVANKNALKINPNVRKVDSKSSIVRRKGIAFTTVESSNLKGFFHDVTKRELLILFNTNRVYRYARVPNYVVAGLANASSKGIYFTANIRYKYSKKEL
jgi:hypothetical protein